MILAFVFVERPMSSGAILGALIRLWQNSFDPAVRGNRSLEVSKPTYLELVDDCKNKRYMINFLDESNGGQDRT
jgi:hypothetical protein